MTITIDTLQDKLWDKLVGTGWDKKLRYFVKSTDMYDILLWLNQEKSNGRRFTPQLNDVFKPFQLCKMDNLKVVLLNDGPYIDPTLNNGLAISHNSTLTETFQFSAFYEELVNTTPKNTLMDADLSSWAKQGILLLNTSLTTRINEVGKHHKIWKPFVYELLDILERMDKMVFVCVGENEFFRKISDKHIKIIVPPLPTERKIPWKSNLFNKINDALVENKQLPIIW